MHHCIFGALCFVMFRGCTAPLVGTALIAQELSTPFLNAFILCRGFLGLAALPTQLFFVAFALLFYALRIGLNSVVTGLFLREVYRGLVGGACLLRRKPRR